MGLHDRPIPLLGGLAPRRFLDRHWQKRPLLVRGAVEGFTGLLNPSELMALACRDEVESRVVIRRAARWEVQHGPFEPRFFRRLPSRGWTLLVQDVNHFVAQGRELLRRFDFIPYFRLDDLMVSYAPAGGGVGPHFDSYDVFLLQGLGRRLWRVSNQRDLALVADAPLKLLADFRAQQEWVLGPGDMLYLPPAWAHDGVAQDHCMTYSIGFRAPGWQELAVQFLSHLQDRVAMPGLYADPALQPATRPARLGHALLRAAAERFNGIRWSQAEVARFLGSYLTEPKPHVFFAPPRRALSLHAFTRRAVRAGVALALKTQMLYAGSAIFINGESVPIDSGRAAPRRLRARLHELADARWLQPSHEDPAALFAHLYAWYRAGYLSLSGARRTR
jgi:50S ribosomal protein L16 3-hydroxylase